MFKRVALVVALACALTQGGAAVAQDSDLVVTGRSREEVQAFVREISATPQGVDQLGRWDRDICPSVTGLSREQGQIIVDRIAMRAAGVGLRVGEPGCAANVFIFFAADSNTFAQRLFEEHRDMFAYHRSSVEVTRGRAALDGFLSDHRPVRWWHVMQEVGADGENLGDNEARSTSPRPPPPDAAGQPPEADGYADMQAVRGHASRLRNNARIDVARALIIVDGVQAGQVPLSGLGDYLAMVTLAQIDPAGDFSGIPTILGIFDLGAPRELTAWDLAYLEGLYSAPRDAITARQQIAEIARRMARTPQ